jgi:hypothetical protein
VPAGTQAIVWLNATQLEMFYGLVMECDATREIKSALAELSPSTRAGRSMLRPYGKLLRQHVLAKKAGASLPAGMQAPALHRIVAGLRLECGGLPPLSRAQQRQARRRHARNAQAPFKQSASAAQLILGGCWGGSGKGGQRFCVRDDALHPLLEVLLAVAPQYCVFNVFGKRPQRHVRFGI